MTNEPQESSVYTVKAVAKKLGISKTHAHKLCKDGTIPSKKLGRRTIVPIAAFHAWLGQGQVKT